MPFVPDADVGTDDLTAEGCGAWSCVQGLAAVKRDGQVCADGSSLGGLTRIGVDADGQIDGQHEWIYRKAATNFSREPGNRVQKVLYGDSLAGRRVVVYRHQRKISCKKQLKLVSGFMIPCQKYCCDRNMAGIRDRRILTYVVESTSSCKKNGFMVFLP